MKNQYNVIKEKVESGILPLVKRTNYGGTEEYTVFSALGEDDDIRTSYWSDNKEEACMLLLFNRSFEDEESINLMDLEIVEYFRPNDLFPSKPLAQGSPVTVKTEELEYLIDGEEVEFLKTMDLEVEWHDGITRRYSVCSRSKQRASVIPEQYVYPRIEKREEKKVEDIIGEASLKALQDNGYTITKK